MSKHRLLEQAKEIVAEHEAIKGMEAEDGIDVIVRISKQANRAGALAQHVIDHFSSQKQTFVTNPADDYPANIGDRQSPPAKQLGYEWKNEADL